MYVIRQDEGQPYQSWALDSEANEHPRIVPAPRTLFSHYWSLEIRGVEKVYCLTRTEFQNKCERHLIRALEVECSKNGCSKVCTPHAGVYEALLLFVADTQPYRPRRLHDVEPGSAKPGYQFPQSFVQMMSARC